MFCLKTKDNSESPLSPSHMAFSLSLAGSVMVTVSFISILPESLQDESISTGYQMLPLTSFLFFMRCLSFGVGCFLYFLLSKCAFPEPDEILGFDEDSKSPFIEADMENTIGSVGSAPTSNQSGSLRGRGTLSTTGKLSPIRKNSKDTRSSKESEKAVKLISPSWSNLADVSRGADLQTANARRAWRVTMLLFVSLAVHNFPEGLAVAASTMHSQQLGITTTVAIALHNIPEGVAIAVPCLAARPDSPWLAFWLASVSGLAEPLGALVSLFVIDKATNGKANQEEGILSMNNILAFVAGIMTTVALIELFPEARRNSTQSWNPFIAGTLVGFIVMVGSEKYLDA